MKVAASADPSYQQLVQQVGRGKLCNHSLAEGLVLHTDRRGARVVVPASDDRGEGPDSGRVA